jgi:hypothetical protein
VLGRRGAHQAPPRVVVSLRLYTRRRRFRLGLSKTRARRVIIHLCCRCARDFARCAFSKLMRPPARAPAPAARTRTRRARARTHTHTHTHISYQVWWSDGQESTAIRSHNELFQFQCKLLDLFPDEASGPNRVIPYLPGKKMIALSSAKQIAEERLPGIME